MRTALFIPATLAALLALVPADASGQWDVLAKAALPYVPYSVTVNEAKNPELIPLIWASDIDGGGSGCCVIGAAAKYQSGPATLWLGLAFGTDPDGGTPAAVEAAAQIKGGAIAFRTLNGRSGVSAFFPILAKAGAASWQVDRLSAGLSSVWLFDDRYQETVPFFDCPANAPSVPCETVPTPYPWSPDQDLALAAEGTWGRGTWRVPRLSGSLVGGLKAGGGDYSYLRAELGARVMGAIRRTLWEVGLSGGWASGGSPLQRRFLLDGADPITRWLNPYIDARGALLEEVPYFIPGGPHLRAYEATQPLVKRYIGVLGELAKEGATESGFWGRAAAFFEAAWTPGIPDDIGRSEMTADGDLLFDWRELPTGEGSAGGQFNTGTLQVSELWADAGLAFSGGYGNLAVMVSLPAWASAPDFANEPIGGGEKKAFALRGSLSVLYYPLGRPGSGMIE
jgi:hypothetical protein